MIEELAKRESMNRGHNEPGVAVAPYIADAILDGRQPARFRAAAV
jgi:hypothetical protein